MYDAELIKGVHDENKMNEMWSESEEENLDKDNDFHYVDSLWKILMPVLSISCDLLFSYLSTSQIAFQKRKYYISINQYYSKLFKGIQWYFI